MNNYNRDQIVNIPSGIKKVLFLLGAVVIFVTIFWSKMTVTIKSGEAGVLFRKFSDGVDVSTTYSEGFHFIAPWNEMFIYEVRQQEVLDKMVVLSSNGLQITLDISCWYQPHFKNLPLLHKEKGMNYLDRVIKPSIRSATRSVIGRYTPEQIYSVKRDDIQDEIYDDTKVILDGQYVQLNKILIRDVTLPPAIKSAIENKLRQEQESLEYEFKLSKARQEAERQRIYAEGKAKANRILNESLTDKILTEKGIEATLKLSESNNSKVIVIGAGKSGMPIILGNQ
ncbi:prohibitin family protein [Ichthyobacterium seriolicida]|uniref:Peptidase n=1 Tax=Ichthyobacterium seriolicida TaxID=242600 RepID=A0A1J1ED43_9FLAO|nr:prohibitin family protein [Ichthyobacterium seriolicida]BAV95440.1 peptidase [Ichthyobacterium seriolicida]